jgi:plastocyanin
MKKQVWGCLCLALSGVLFIGCGDDEETPRPATGSTSSSSGSESSSSSTSSSSSGMGGGGGAGGMGGMGGMAASSSSSSSSSSGGMGGMGGAGGSGGGEMGLNGCVQAMADDLTGMANTTIQFAGLSYTPKCIRVKAGTNVTFEGNFALHPLEGGTVVNGIPTADPMSPITLTNTGMSKTFTLMNAGDVPYYCTAHAVAGMKGAIFVEP